MKHGKRIVKVTISRTLDKRPDTSHFGTYSHTRTSRFSIDRAHALDCPVNLGSDAECKCPGDSWKLRQGEPRYFNPSFNDVDENDKALPGATAQDIRQRVRRDYERLESRYKSPSRYIDIQAVAEIDLLQGDSQLAERITSRGRCIESDFEPSLLAQIEQGELDSLRDALRQLGFGRQAVSKAFENVQRG